MTASTPGEPNPDVVDGELVEQPATQSPTTEPTTATPGHVPPVADPYYSESGVPTFDFVRDKIENRVATAIGSQELAEESAEGRAVDDMMRARDDAAKKRLEEIRKSMGS